MAKRHDLTNRQQDANDKFKQWTFLIFDFNKLKFITRDGHVFNSIHNS